jgi:hypothetical protein
MTAPQKRPATARSLGESLVATADHMHPGGESREREKLWWLASIVAATRPDLARQIVLRWGAPNEVA